MIAILPEMEKNPTLVSKHVPVPKNAKNVGKPNCLSTMFSTVHHLFYHACAPIMCTPEYNNLTNIIDRHYQNIKKLVRKPSSVVGLYVDSLGSLVERSPSWITLLTLPMTSCGRWGANRMFQVATVQKQW